MVCNICIYMHSLTSKVFGNVANSRNLRIDKDAIYLEKKNMDVSTEGPLSES